MYPARLVAVVLGHVAVGFVICCLFGDDSCGTEGIMVSELHAAAEAGKSMAHGLCPAHVVMVKTRVQEWGCASRRSVGIQLQQRPTSLRAIERHGGQSRVGAVCRILKGRALRQVASIHISPQLDEHGDSVQKAAACRPQAASGCADMELPRL